MSTCERCALPAAPHYIGTSAVCQCAASWGAMSDGIAHYNKERGAWLIGSEATYLRDTNGKLSPIAAWGVDFCRAFNERPRLLQWIARQCMGRYAWRELMGVREALNKAGYDPGLPYGLESMDYHQEGQ
jgi:hypothetical protein